MMLMAAPAAAATAQASNYSSSHYLFSKLNAASGSDEKGMPPFLADKNGNDGDRGGDDRGRGNDKGGGKDGGNNSDSGSGSSSSQGGDSGSTGSGGAGSSNGSGANSSSSSSSSAGGTSSPGGGDAGASSSPGSSGQQQDQGSAPPAATAAAQQQELVQAQEPAPAVQAAAAADDTLPDSYFVDKPLRKVQLVKYYVVNANGTTVSTVGTGDDIAVIAVFKNVQKKDQNYMLITQVLDQSGYTVDLSWSVDTVESGGSIDWLTAWKAQEPGVYTIKTLVWGTGGNSGPASLSEPSVTAIIVQPG
jgi:hypothetical protein